MLDKNLTLGNLSHDWHPNFLMKFVNRRPRPECVEGSGFENSRILHNFLVDGRWSMVDA